MGERRRGVRQEAHPPPIGWRLSLWILVPVAIAVSYGTVVLRTRASAACDIGVNVGADVFGHLPAMMMMLLVNVGVVVAVRYLTSWWAGLIIVLVVFWVTAWLYLSVSGPPADYPGPVSECLDNIPNWWPGWLPR